MKQEISKDIAHKKATYFSFPHWEKAGQGKVWVPISQIGKVSVNTKF